METQQLTIGKRTRTREREKARERAPLARATTSMEVLGMEQLVMRRWRRLKWSGKKLGWMQVCNVKMGAFLLFCCINRLSMH